MSDPRPVVTVPGLAFLVGANLGQSLFIGLGVVLDRDLGRHPAHGVDVAPVAGLDDQLRIGAHERGSHRHLGPVRQDECGVVLEFAYGAEDIIPAAAVQAGRVLPQFPEDFIHLKGSQDVFDQDRGPNGASRDSEGVLGPDKDVVPQAGLQMAFQLGQVEVWPGAARDRVAGVVEEVKAEVEQRRRHRLPVNEDVPLVQVPAARPHQQDGRLLVQVVRFSLGAGEGDGAIDRVPQVDLPFERGVPGRRMRVLEVGHVDVGAGVERVDDHLAVDRAGDLDPAIPQVIGDGGHGPGGFANFGRLRQKIGQLSGIDFLLAILPAAQ